MTESLKAHAILTILIHDLTTCGENYVHLCIQNSCSVHISVQYLYRLFTHIDIDVIDVARRALWVIDTLQSSHVQNMDSCFCNEGQRHFVRNGVEKR